MNQINLVPIAYKQKYKRKWYILFGVMGSAVTCMILVTLALIPTFQIKAAEREEEYLVAALATSEMQETREILNKTAEAEKRKEKAAKLIEELDAPTHITRQTMDVVVGSVPRGLRMNEVVMEKKDYNIIIDGQAHSITKVAQYIVQLYNTGQFDIVEYSANPNEDSKITGWIDYNIRIKPKNLMTEEEIRQAEEARKALESEAAAENGEEEEEEEGTL